MTTSSSAITGIDFAYVFGRDFAKTVDFYENVLGIKCSRRYERAPGAEFDVGNLTLVVINPADYDMAFNANTHPIALRVDDFAAARAQLEARGVAFKHVLDSGVCHMGFFDDPDGNALLIHQRYAEDD